MSKTPLPTKDLAVYLYFLEEEVNDLLKSLETNQMEAFAIESDFMKGKPVRRRIA